MRSIKSLIYDALFYRVVVIVLQVLIFWLLTSNLDDSITLTVICNIVSTIWYLLYHHQADKIRSKYVISNDKKLIKCYISHPIRGAKREKATSREMKANCDQAKRVTNRLRKLLPELSIYCPAEHEDFVGLAYKRKYLTERQILTIDCKIVRECQILLAYCPTLDFPVASNGMMKEIGVAKKYNIFVIEVRKIDLKTISNIQKVIKRVSMK